MTDPFMKQCKLLKQGTVQTAWIPEEYSKVGKYLQLELNGEWEDGWQVVEAYVTRRRQSDVIARSQDYKKTREASDI